MRKNKKQSAEYGNEVLVMNGIRTSVAKAFAGIFIRVCNICKIIITVVPIAVVLYLVGYIFFKENMLALFETIKNAFSF